MSVHRWGDRGFQGVCAWTRRYRTGFASHSTLLFHKSKGCSLRVRPLHHEGVRGVFATRHPDRPNPIGFTIVELLERRGNVLRVRGVDMVDGTPVVDIKPHTYIWRSEEKHQTRLDKK